MIRRFLATTALTGFIATGAFAQATTTTPSDQPSSTEPTATGTMTPATGATAGANAPSGDVRYITALRGEEYLATDLDGTDVYPDSSAEAKKVGDIDNFLVGKDGKIIAAVVSTGSFLDQSKTVAVPFEKIDWTTGPDQKRRAVLTATREELTAAPAFTEVPASSQVATETPALAPASGESAAVKPPAALAPRNAEMQGGYAATVGSDQYLSEKIIGENVYSGPAEDAKTIGNVNDIVIEKSGRVAAVVVGVGGFLGIGEKNVGVPFDAMTLTKDGSDKIRAILAATKEQLTAAPTFETDEADTASANGAPAGASSQAGMSADTTTTASTGNATDRSQLTAVSGPDLTAERLVGTVVYGPNDENIGKVGDIALTPQGQVDAVIVDVGGFLGIGSKPVAVAMDNLKFMTDKGGSMMLYTEFTQDQLENAPEYNRSTYAQNRDRMRIEPGAALAPATQTVPASGGAAAGSNP